MSSRSLRLRQLAGRDIDEAVAYYADQGGEALALRFVDALETAFDRIGARPAMGSPRYAIELDLPGLRFWPLKRFPYLVFYVERKDHVDVWRVLHGQRDIPDWLQKGERTEVE